MLVARDLRGAIRAGTVELLLSEVPRIFQREIIVDLAGEDVTQLRAVLSACLKRPKGFFRYPFDEGEVPKLVVHYVTELAPTRRKLELC